MTDALRPVSIGNWPWPHGRPHFGGAGDSAYSTAARTSAVAPCSKGKYLSANQAPTPYGDPHNHWGTDDPNPLRPHRVAALRAPRPAPILSDELVRRRSVGISLRIGSSPRQQFLFVVMTHVVSEQPCSVRRLWPESLMPTSIPREVHRWQARSQTTCKGRMEGKYLHPFFIAISSIACATVPAFE